MSSATVDSAVRAFQAENPIVRLYFKQSDESLNTYKLSAIKLLRYLTSLGLKEAKDAVEGPYFSVKVFRYMEEEVIELFDQCGYELIVPEITVTNT